MAEGTASAGSGAADLAGLFAAAETGLGSIVIHDHPRTQFLERFKAAVEIVGSRRHLSEQVIRNEGSDCLRDAIEAFYSDPTELDGLRSHAQRAWRGLDAETASDAATDTRDRILRSVERYRAGAGDFALQSGERLFPVKTSFRGWIRMHVAFRARELGKAAKKRAHPSLDAEPVEPVDRTSATTEERALLRIAEEHVSRTVDNPTTPIRPDPSWLSPDAVARPISPKKDRYVADLLLVQQQTFHSVANQLRGSSPPDSQDRKVREAIARVRPDLAENTVSVYRGRWMADIAFGLCVVLDQIRTTRDRPPDSLNIAFDDWRSTEFERVVELTAEALLSEDLTESRVHARIVWMAALCDWLERDDNKSDRAIVRAAGEVAVDHYGSARKKHPAPLEVARQTSAIPIAQSVLSTHHRLSRWLDQERQNDN